MLAGNSLHAQEDRVGEVRRVATRDGVTVPVAIWRSDAVATVVLSRVAQAGTENRRRWLAGWRQLPDPYGQALGQSPLQCRHGRPRDGRD